MHHKINVFAHDLLMIIVTETVKYIYIYIKYKMPDIFNCTHLRELLTLLLSTSKLPAVHRNGIERVVPQIILNISHNRMYTIPNAHSFHTHIQIHFIHVWHKNTSTTFNSVVIYDERQPFFHHSVLRFHFH